MGKFVLAGFVILCTALMGISIAQETQKQQPPPTQEATDTQKKAIAGEVVSIDPTKKEIVIKDEAGVETHLLISTSTKITQAGKTITLSDVKVGDKLTSDCEASADGCKAKSISIMAPPKSQ